MESGGLHAYTVSKESERFISVRAAAAQNPPQTFRVRERSKSGYASRLLSVHLSVHLLSPNPDFTPTLVEAL